MGFFILRHGAQNAHKFVIYRIRYDGRNDSFRRHWCPSSGKKGFGGFSVREIIDRANVGARQLRLSLNRPLLAASGASGEPRLIPEDLRRYNFQ
jgi:hypothetical protein